MNYRHAFHAGNFADVVKHAVLVCILVHLREKPAPFRVIDTHAGAGRYDLAAEEAQRSGEWREGIDRLVRAPIAARERALLAPYLDAVAACNGAGRLTTYPGSPALARRNGSSPASSSRTRRLRSRAISPATDAARRWRSTAGPRSTPTRRSFGGT